MAYLNFCLQAVAKLRMFFYIHRLWTSGLVPLKSVGTADTQHLWQLGHMLMRDLVIIQKSSYFYSFFFLCHISWPSLQSASVQMRPLPWAERGQSHCQQRVPGVRKGTRHRAAQDGEIKGRKWKTKIFRGKEREIGREESEAMSVSAAPALSRRQRSYSESLLWDFIGILEPSFSEADFVNCYAANRQMGNSSKGIPLPIRKKFFQASVLQLSRLFLFCMNSQRCWEQCRIKKGRKILW